MILKNRTSSRYDESFLINKNKKKIREFKKMKQSLYGPGMKEIKMSLHIMTLSSLCNVRVCV